MWSASTASWSRGICEAWRLLGVRVGLTERRFRFAWDERRLLLPKPCNHDERQGYKREGDGERGHDARRRVRHELASAPKSATPTAPPTWRRVLNTALAMPACEGSLYLSTIPANVGVMSPPPEPATAIATATPTALSCPPSIRNTA